MEQKILERAYTYLAASPEFWQIRRSVGYLAQAVSNISLFLAFVGRDDIHIAIAAVLLKELAPLEEAIAKLHEITEEGE